MRISGIVPCLNEEGNIHAVYNRLSKVLSTYDDYEIIFIDDGSTDGTLERIMELTCIDTRVRYISFTRNYGLEAAFRMGFLYAAFEWCIQYDADLQSPPEETFRLVEKAKEGYDVVFGIRKKRKDSLFRILGSKGQHFIATKILNIRLPVGASVFRIVRTSIAKRIVGYPSRTAYFIATVPLVTSNYTTVEVEHHPREWGRSKWNFIKMLRHSNELFFGFSNRLLDFGCIASLIGIGCLMPFLIFAALAERITNRLVCMVVCVLSVIQLFTLAAITQYMKYPSPNNVISNFVFIRDSNIEACIAEGINDTIIGGQEIEY